VRSGYKRNRVVTPFVVRQFGAAGRTGDDDEPGHLFGRIAHSSKLRRGNWVKTQNVVLQDIPVCPKVNRPIRSKMSGWFFSGK
jgi:uncharacterized protein YfaA (DUF2138 family)